MCFSYRLPTGSVLIKAHQFSDQAPPSTSGEPRLQHQVSPQYQTIPTRITRRSPSLLPCEPRPQHQTSPKPGGPHPHHRPGEPPSTPGEGLLSTTGGPFSSSGESRPQHHANPAQHQANPSLMTTRAPPFPRVDPLSHQG